MMREGMVLVVVIRIDPGRWSARSSGDAHNAHKACAIRRRSKSDESCDVANDVVLRKQAINVAGHSQPL